LFLRLGSKVQRYTDEGAAANHWQVKADEVYGWMQAMKTDFVIVDVRPNPPDSRAAGCPEPCTFLQRDPEGRESQEASKDKKVILVCVTGRRKTCLCWC